jgi:acetyltransferase-like isoleucine patch superfamily enzyme
MLSKVLRGGRQVRLKAGSACRLALLRAEFPGLRIEGRVHISRDCDIYVAADSRMVLRGCYIAPGVTLLTGPGATLDVGADFVGPGSILVARESVVIGNGTKIGEHVTVRDGNHDHSVPLREMKFTASPVRLGEDVWLGAKATVLAGVAVGGGASVGAGSVVTKDVEPGSKVGGVPARPLGSRGHTGKGGFDAAVVQTHE